MLVRISSLTTSHGRLLWPLIYILAFLLSGKGPSQPAPKFIGNIIAFFLNLVKFPLDIYIPFSEKINYHFQKCKYSSIYDTLTIKYMQKLHYLVFRLAWMVWTLLVIHRINLSMKDPFHFCFLFLFLTMNYRLQSR